MNQAVTRALIQVVVCVGLSTRHYSSSMAFRVYKGPHPSCTRLRQVVGNSKKKNDVIYYGPIGAPLPSRNIIFFPGDVQEYPEVMLSHYDTGKYVGWNLESTAERLALRFPDSHIWVIKPAKMQLATFSVFSNFVKSNTVGVPTFGDSQGSWHHLHALMEGAVERVHALEECPEEVVMVPENKEKTISKAPWSETETAASTSSRVGGKKAPTGLPSDGTSLAAMDVTFVGPKGPSLYLPTAIIGFSKGCVVLNQLVHDLTEAHEDPKIKKLLDCVDHVYWLDGGHNGGSNTWLIHDRIVDKLIGLNWHYHVHVTPYQIKDSFRKWIGIEYKRFVEKLKSRGFEVENVVHFRGEERSIENHFRVLDVF